MQNTTRAVIQQPGGLTLERALELINANHARTPLTADQVYVLRMVLSNQAVDSYDTRMSRPTLLNYGDEFRIGRALMNSHRTSVYGGAELPVGRTFETELTGEFLPDNAPYEAGPGASLGVYAYIQRGLRVTDVPTDSLIAGIDGGTVNDVSVGFTLSPDGMYRCSLCGSNLMDWETCTHVPGATYDNGRCFAWVDQAHGREASLVYAGATPDTIIDKAIRMAETGQLARADAIQIGERWGARILGGKPFQVSKPAQPEPDDGSRAAPDTPAPEPADGTGNTQREEETRTMDWETFLSDLRAMDVAQADRIAALEESARPAAVIGVLREQRATIDSLQPRAVLGDQWLDDLVNQAVTARVRAEGSEFDGEKYRRMLRASNDPAFIKAEVESWTRQVKATFGDGKRPTGGHAAVDAAPSAPPAVYK